MKNRFILALLIFAFVPCFSQKGKYKYIFSQEIAELDTPIYDIEDKLRLQTLYDLKMIVQYNQVKTKENMKNKIFKHEGSGHYIGSCIIVVDTNSESAKAIIRKTLNEQGLEKEELNIETIDIKSGKVVYVNNGDY